MYEHCKTLNGLEWVIKDNQFIESNKLSDGWKCVN